MGEIDTKSIESVQAALSLFGEKSSDKKKFRSTSCINVSQLLAKLCSASRKNEMKKENDIGSVLKDLANLKIQVEAKDSAHKQALVKLDHHENTADELCSLLMSSEFEKEIYMIECRGLRIHVVELESRIQEMADQMLESVKMREQLSHAIGELKATQGELLIAERELVATKDAKLEALTQVEVMESALSSEKFKTEELLRNVSKLNETVLQAEENITLLYEREEELELKAANAKEEVELLRNQLEMMQDLENELLDKSALIDSLRIELQQVNELRVSSEKATSDAVSEVKKLKDDMELQERKNWDQSGYISLLESELRQLKGELNKANEEATRANADVETISIELEQFKKEMVETREKESEAQVEIAFLQSELHKGRSKIAAAEVADSVAKSEKSAFHLALQQLALEAEEAKKENKKLKEASKASEKTQKEESEEGNGESKAYITIPREEYEQLIKKKEPVCEEPNEIQALKKELKTATVKISELRTRTEQAISRAEAAEKGKATLEDQIKRWKEHKERKKAALAALREESISREITEYKADTSPKTLQPLGKVLRMKF